MQLSIREVARGMGVNESAVYRWVAEEQLPSERINGQYLFNKTELLEWATQHKIVVPPALFQTGSGNGHLARLDAALKAGGIHFGLPGPDKAAVLEQVVRCLPLPPEVDQGQVLAFFLGRESLGSTGIGDGLALPHPRYPMVLAVDQPSISLCFLEKPIPYASPDHKPVHTLFALISPTVRVHNQMLARLGCALRDADFRQVVRQKSSAEEILRQARRVEDSLRSAAAAGERPT